MEKLIDVDLERLYQQMSEDKELYQLLNTTKEEFEKSTDPELKKYFYLLKEMSFVSFQPLTLLEILRAPPCGPICLKKHLKFLENKKNKIIGLAVWETQWTESIKDAYQIVVFPFYKSIDINIEKGITLLINHLLSIGYDICWSIGQENPIREIYDKVDREYQNSKDIEDKGRIWYSVTKEE